MSADNWAICPRCKLKPNPYHEPLTTQFREDYEIGVLESGEFYVDYHGRCRDCGLEKVFHHSEQLKL